MSQITKLYPVLIGTIIFLVYFWGVDGQFQFDDYPNIVLNERLHINSLGIESITKASLSSSSGQLRRPISMMSFAINHYLSGLNPFSYKLTNIAIHLINSIGIYFLCLLLLNNTKSIKFSISNRNLAFIVAIAWGVNPVNLTAVLYIVQRMTSLAMLFTICAIYLYLKAREEINNNHFRKGGYYLVSVVIFWLLGIFSKENAALVFLYLIIIEALLYREEAHTKKYNKILVIFFSTFLIIPALIVSVYTIYSQDWILRGYSTTHFSMYERVLTELRVVWLYLYWIILPKNSSLGFFHDDIALSTSLLDQTLPLIAGIAHLLFISFLTYLWKAKKQALMVLGFFLFYASHLLESTVIPLMLVFEHRNYFGSFGVLLAIFSIIFSAKSINRNLVLISIGMYLSILGFMTAQRATTWGNGIQNALVDIKHHPKSAAAHYELGRQYFKTEDTPDSITRAKTAFQKASELDTKRADALFALLYLSVKKDLPVKQELIDKLSFRLRNNAIYAVNVVWMDTLIKCYLNKTCPIKKQDMITIIESALDNQQLDDSKQSKSYFLMITSLFLVNGGNNYKQALELSTIAANTSPGEVKFSINVVNLALSHGDHGTAEIWIDKLNKSFLSLYPKEINSLELRLEKSIKEYK